MRAAVRRENIVLNREVSGSGLRATVKEKRFAGGVLQIFAELQDGSEIIATRHGLDSDIKTGDSVFLTWEPENSVLVDTEAANET